MVGGKKPLAIGVTGHRALKDVELLSAGVDRALGHIDHCFPTRDWSVLSSLAEGADRLVVARVLAYKPDARLVVPLPMPPEPYKVIFSSEDSRREFERLLAQAAQVIPPQTDKTDEEAYLAAGITLLDRIDLLIALWDGLPARGRGGTAEIVALARERGMPLAWVRVGEALGTVVYERFLE